MFADQTLTPREAVRLCALGTIAASPMRYSELAGAVRHFISRITGPSLDLLGPSIELLRFEGMVEPVEGTGMEDDALLHITAQGHEAFRELMVARLRPSSDLSKLVTALKFRFLHLLDDEEQKRQADQLLDIAEQELNRLEDLRQGVGDYGESFDAWLDLEITQAEARLTWIEDFTKDIFSRS